MESGFGTMLTEDAGATDLGPMTGPDATRVIAGRITSTLQVGYGLLYAAAGASWFVPSFPRLCNASCWFENSLIASGLFTVAKVLEILGGILLLTGRFGPLGAAILLPVSMVIAFNDIVLEQGAAYIAIGVVWIGIHAIVIFRFGPFFLPFLTGKAWPTKPRRAD
jgi:uncharacterized membrane protein YphA (DoxX/SURF4 family)